MLKISKVIGVFIFVIVTGFVAPTAFAEPVEMLVSKNWGAYRYDNNDSRICFVSSVPTKSKGKYDPKNRGDIRVFVSHGPGKAERDVVQVIAGYRYKPQSDVSLTIDGRAFKLFTIEDRAYAESEEDDRRIIVLMRRGSRMTIVGISSRGTKTTDTYSLSGFTKTKAVIDKTCK
ncbi:invasion associated locus B family protein [Candidatus Puniceispirillum sp.]|nr:invasion associated locus B family protein [Candidatus Puniceispirillum sp.]